MINSKKIAAGDGSTPEPPASKPITTEQVAALKKELDDQKASNQRILNGITWGDSCADIYNVLSSTMSYFSSLSTQINQNCKNGPTTDCINNLSKNLYASFAGSFPTKKQITLPKPLYYTPTGLNTGSKYADYSTLLTNIGQICSGLPPGPSSDEPRDLLWNALADKMTALKASIDKTLFQTPYQSQCKHPGAQDYITSFSRFVSDVLTDISQHATKKIGGVNSAIGSTYNTGIGAVPTVQELPIPKQFVFTYKTLDTEITITPPISEYTTFYMETLYNFCAQRQNYYGLLKGQEDCFDASSKQLQDIIQIMNGESDIKSCRDKQGTNTCITVNNEKTKLAMGEANGLKKYVDLIGKEFTAKLTEAQKTTPITLKVAQDLVSAFNTYASNNFTNIPGLNNFEGVQLSSPISMTAPISGCLWGDLATTIGGVLEIFNNAVIPCTLKLRCGDHSTPKTGTFPPPVTDNWSTFYDIFNYACSATDPCPKDNVILLCNLTTDLRYVMEGQVWAGSIKGILDKLTNADSTGFFDYCQGETPTDTDKLNKSYWSLKQEGYITTVPIKIPNVDNQIAQVKAAVTDKSLDNEYNAYRAYINKMKVWLKLYFGPDVGTFLVNTLQSNYLDWYNSWHPDPSKMGPGDFKTIEDFLWSPRQLIDGVLNSQATTLLEFVTGTEYKSLMAQVEIAFDYNTTISMGKYTLAIGLEYAVEEKQSDEKTKIMTVLRKLPAIMPQISYIMDHVAAVEKNIVAEFLKLLKDSTYGPTFTSTLKKTINALLDSDSTFTKDLAAIKDFIEKKEGGYKSLVAGINTKYPGIKSCGDEKATNCGSNFPGGQASIWQDTGSMWSHFPPPDGLVPVDPQLSTASAPTVESLFGPWFKARAQQGVFNYHLSFAQLDVVGDILNGKKRAVDDTTLNDTLLPYVLYYQKAKGSSTQMEALEGFLKDLKASLKKNTNNKGNLGLSFGGENATLADNKLSKESGTTELFYNTILKNVDSVDFDMENAGFTSEESKYSCSDQCGGGGACTNQCSFFKTIRGFITKEYGAMNTSCLLEPKSTGCEKYSSQPKMYLTLLGDPAISIKKLNMGPLMSNSVEYFDGVNLMLYDNGTGYYITANADTAWSLQKWAAAIDLNTDSSETIRDTFAKLSPCYQDRTPYYDPKADKGEKVNWALAAEKEINKIYGPSGFEGSFLQSLDVGSAAWVINRQFWQDSLSSYTKVGQEDIMKFLNAKASSVSWWPDNNLHGSLCTSNGDACNQYGVQQDFSACQILWQLGYNPFTFEEL